jgi:ribosome-associated toxin RatA of RatAB toxin-antitoxin module
VDPDTPQLDAATRRRLDRGEVLVNAEPVAGSAYPRIAIDAVVEAPPERVWAIIDDTGNYKHTLAGVKDSRELSRDGDRVRVRVTVGMPFPLRDLTSVTDGVHSVEPGQRYERRWTLVEGSYRKNDGSWTLTPFDGDPGRTLVRYRLHVEPRVRIPARVLKLGQQKAAPSLIHKLRQRVTR